MQRLSPGLQTSTAPWATIFLLLASCLWQPAWAARAGSQREINPTGGVAVDGSDGLRWWLGSNSQIQVHLGGQGQVYEPGSRPTDPKNATWLYNSVMLRVDRGTDATTRLYHESDDPSASPPGAAIRFIEVSQSAVSGAGTFASPWTVTTVLRPSEAADSGITITIIDRYIRPQMWLTRRVELTGLPAGPVFKLYQNIDTYLQGGDNGPGFSLSSPWNSTPTPDLVGVLKGDLFQALWYEPSSGTPHWDRYFSGEFTAPVFQACSGTSDWTTCKTGTGDLLNEINTDPATDNGMAVQWNIPSGASSFTAEYRITFATGAVDLDKAFAPNQINTGGISTLTFNLTNRTSNAVGSVNFTDTLPAGVAVAPEPNVRTSCPTGGTSGTTLPAGMVVNAPAGGSTITVSNANIAGAPIGSPLSCQILVDVTSSTVGSHHNTTASLSGLNNLVNLVGDEVLTVVGPVLAVAKSVDGNLVAGQSGASTDGHFLIQVSNSGSGPTHLPLQIRDILPALFTATAASSSQGTVDCGTLPATGTLDCSFVPTAPLDVGASATIRLDVAIASSATGSVTNHVGVAGGGDPGTMPTCPEPDQPRCAEATATLVQQADLSVTKSNDSDVLLRGSPTEYIIRVSNAGPSDADGAIVRDAAVDHLTCTDVTCEGEINGAVCPSVTISALQDAGVAVPSLPAGGALSFRVTCTVQ